MDDRIRDSDMQSVFRGFVVDAHAGDLAPDALNGAGGVVDVTNVTSFVDPTALVAVNANRQFDLRANLAYNIYCGQGRPDVATAATLEHLQAAAKSIARTYERFSILDMMAHSNFDRPISYRALDIMQANQVAAIPGIDELLQVSDLIHERVLEDPVFRAKLIPEGHLAMTSIVANALHRVHTTGHNWYTDAAGRRGTPTNRTLAVAGADRDLFEDFMSREGHDMWHFLADGSLNDCADAITGENQVTLAADYILSSGEPAGEGATIADIVKVSQAAKDRWPVGTVGISAIILAIPLIRDMITQLCVRTGAATADDTDSALDDICRKLSLGRVSRGKVMAVRDMLQELASIAFGFNEGLYSSDDANRNYPSLIAYANRDAVGKLHGKMIGTWAKGTAIQDASIAGIVTNVMGKSDLRAAAATGQLATVVADYSDSDEESEASEGTEG